MPNTPNKKSVVAGAAFIVMISIVASRLTGFVRETLIPNFIGFTHNADAYNQAFKITGLMYDLLVGGAIAAALIPVLSGYIAKGDEKNGWRAVSTFMNVIFLLMSSLCLLGILFAGPLVKLLAPGFVSDGAQFDLTVSLVRILFPSVAFLMLTGLTNGVLNSYRRFVASAFGPTIYNLGCSLSIVLFGRKEIIGSAQTTNIKNIAYGIVLTSFLYLILQLTLARKNLKHYSFSLELKNPAFLKLVKLAIPSLMASSIVQINVLILSSFASLIPVEGIITAYNVADRTWQMPYGIFAQGLGIAMLPTISAMSALGEIDNFKSLLSKALKFVAYITIPFCLLFILTGNEVISTLFKFTDKFDPSYIRLTASILAFFSFAMISQSLVAILNRAFYATNNTKIPLYTGLSTVIVIFCLCTYFTYFTNFGAKGMALSYTIASLINAILLYVLLVKKIGSLNGRFSIFAGKTALAGLFTAAFLYFVNATFPIEDSTKLLQLLKLFLMALSTFAIYGWITWLTRLEEANYLRAKLSGLTAPLKRFLTNRGSARMNKDKAG